MWVTKSKRNTFWLTCMLCNRRYDSCFLKWYSESKFLTFLLFLPLLLLQHLLRVVVCLLFVFPCYCWVSSYTTLSRLQSSMTRGDLLLFSWESRAKSSREKERRWKTDNLQTEYLRGTATSDECEPLFAKYKQCLSVSSPFNPSSSYLLSGSSNWFESSYSVRWRNEVLTRCSMKLERTTAKTILRTWDRAVDDCEAGMLFLYYTFISLHSSLIALAEQSIFTSCILTLCV